MPGVNTSFDLLVILGPTASGKTRLAARIASRCDGEIISADSRQVYRGMDIGTGKDLEDYQVGGQTVPFHLIDIAEPGEEYNVFRFQRDFRDALEEIRQRGHLPVLCGGTGLYLESVLAAYRFSQVPENRELREEMMDTDTAALIQRLASLHPLHSTTDTGDRERLYRAIEIATFQQEHPESAGIIPVENPLIVVLGTDRTAVRRRITERLRLRLEQGMTEEVRRLIDGGVPVERLLAYGLEYRYLTRYLQGELEETEMFRLLNIAIHQFAKRQMTWFRGMERKGFNIRWLEADLDDEEKTEKVLAWLTEPGT